MEEYAGQDATRAFDEFGHSLDAKRMLKTLLVGELMEVKIYNLYFRIIFLYLLYK